MVECRVVVVALLLLACFLSKKKKKNKKEQKDRVLYGVPLYAIAVNALLLLWVLI